MANLQRNIRKPRNILANSGAFGRLEPFSYHHVFAGESQHNIKTQLSFRSKPIKMAMSGCTIDIWYYYVPWRLVWSDFPTWVMGDSTLSVPDEAGNLAITNSLFGSHGGSGGQATLLPKCYEMIVNQYFREEHDQYTVSASPAVLPIVDRTAETQGDEDYENEDETIDVSSGTLSLREISRKRAKLQYDRKVESLDGKYTSYLRAQGVNANEAVAQIPEFLGHYRKYIKPSKTVNESTGLTVQTYNHECTHTLTKRRFFQEHGVVIGVCSMRPKVHLKGGYNRDAYVFEHPSMFPHVGQLAEMKKIMVSPDHATLAYRSDGGYENETDGTPSTYLNIDHFLWHGRTHVIDSDDDFILSYDPTDDETALYPSAAWDAALVTSASTHFFVEGVNSTKIATPLRRLRVQ